MSPDNEQQPNTGATNVTLADDDKDDQLLFKEAVKEGDINAEVTVANDGNELMQNLKDPAQPNPDIIFLDINMPGKDGKECLKEIKEDENLKDIPTVMLTTSVNNKDIEETYGAGANLYVPKPSSFRVFVNLLKKIFRMHWSHVLMRPFRKNFVLSEKDVARD